MNDGISTWRTALSESMANVLDTMAMRDFVSGDEGHSASALDEKSCYATLTLTGARRATFGLAMSHGAAMDVAGAILGVDPSEIGPVDLQDAVCELLNMFVGDVKTRLGGQYDEIILGTPVPSDVDWSGVQHGAGDRESRVDVRGRLGEDPIEVWAWVP